MGRTILGAVVGLVLAVITIMLVELAGHMAFPPPPGLNPQVTADMAKIIATQPLAALLFVVAAWTMGAFDGGFVAALIARKGHPRAAALVPALMVMTGVVAMIVAMPEHPKWMAICGLLLPIPVALLGAALATRLKPAGR
jgi:energy-converting hydrogenase Eha subunit B